MSLIEGILQRAGVETKPHTFKKGEVQLSCPFCLERGLGDDTGQHLGVNFDSGKGHCFRCDWNARDIMYTARALSRVYKIPFVLRYVESEPQKPKKTPRTLPVGLPVGYEAFNGNKDSIERKMRAYLEKRGVSTSQIVRHKIGFAAVGEMAWRILFPVRDEDGKVYGCVGRTIMADVEPKYLNTIGIKLLWGANESGSTAVIVEGVLDALRVEQALLSHRGYVAVARLGSAITPVQLHQLRRFENRVILPDWDVPGMKGAMELARECAVHGMPVKFALPEAMTGLDPGAMTMDQIEDMLSSALPWNEKLKFRIRKMMAA